MEQAAGEFANSASGGWKIPLLRFLRVALYLGLAVVIGLVIELVTSARHDVAVMRASIDKIDSNRGLVPKARKSLAAGFTDKQGRLLADAPTDPKQLLELDTLTLAHYVDQDEDSQLVNWQALQNELAEATGLKVVTQEFWNGADDVEAVKAGKVQLVALHAADTPYLVNNAGFIPIAVLGTEAGAHGNQLDIAVPAGSKIQSLADLRGHKLTCTAPIR